MGMSYDEFWNMRPSLAKSYREAMKIQKQQVNERLWLQGHYIYNALLCVAPVMRASLSGKPVQPGQYPDKPYSLTREEMEEEQVRRERLTFEKGLAKLNAWSEETLKKQREEVSDDANEHRLPVGTDQSELEVGHEPGREIDQGDDQIEDRDGRQHERESEEVRGST